MCEPPARDDTMDMDMVIQFLVPGMEYLDDTRCCPEILLVRGKLQERFCAASVEQAIQKLLVTVNQWI